VLASFVVLRVATVPAIVALVRGAPRTPQVHPTDPSL
jgi:hypothetical protein